MTNHLSYDLQQLGHLARASDLRGLGHSRSSIDAAIRAGWLARPVYAWLASRQARRDALIAIAHRGVLTNSSALESYGVWRGIDTRIHVLVPAHSAGGHKQLLVDLSEYPAPRKVSSGLERHWGTPRFALSGWRVGALDALRSFATTQAADHFVAAVDSALHTGVLSPAMLPRLAAELPARLRPQLLRVDGRSEAGTETIARLGLAVLGRSVTIQVTVGPHRLDILIDGWLNIEIDSEAWHGTDRLKFSRRDTWLTGRGYFVLRFDYHEVMFEWPACVAAIRATLSLGPSTAR